MSSPLVAVDIGNARIKLGLFADDCAVGLPEPVRTLPLLGDAPSFDGILPWLGDAGDGFEWWIASVNRPATSRLLDWLDQCIRHTPCAAVGTRSVPDTLAGRIALLYSGDLPLDVRLPRPDMVGIDRLVDAVAVNRLRDAGRPAVIVDVGSAITVDLVSADGAFLGGAIVPGIAMSARALHEFTDLLPLIDMSELTAPPPALGTATVPAMESGLFWGAVGAIRQLIERLGAEEGKRDSSRPSFARCPPERPDQPSVGARCFAQKGTVPFSPPQIFLTGGAGASVAQLLGPDARYVPNLTLAGIALAARNGRVPA